MRVRLPLAGRGSEGKGGFESLYTTAGHRVAWPDGSGGLTAGKDRHLISEKQRLHGQEEA